MSEGELISLARRTDFMGALGEFMKPRPMPVRPNTTLPAPCSQVRLSTLALHGGNSS